MMSIPNVDNKIICVKNKMREQISFCVSLVMHIIEVYVIRTSTPSDDRDFS